MAANGSGKMGGRLTEGDPAEGVGERLAELQSYVSYYVQTQVDRVKVIARTAIVFGVLGAIGALVGAAVVVTSAVLLVVGVAGGLGALCGGHVWIGDLITAVLILGGLVLGVILVSKKLTKTSRGKLVQTYEQRASKQRDSFGADVHQRAGERGRS